MTRIFVYESLSGQRHDAPVDAGLLAAGVAMRDAIVADLQELGGFRVTWADGGAHGDADPTRVAPHRGEAERDFVRRVAGSHDHAWIVAPETGGTLLALHAAVRPERWIGCDAASLRIASSKTLTLAALAAAGLPTPLAFGGRRRGRWLVKPDDGAGTLATCVHPTLDAARVDLARRHAAGESATLEPFVDGEPMSISLIVGADLARPIAFNRQRIAIGADGSLSDLGVQGAAIDARLDARAETLRAMAIQATSALPGLRGFVGIDLVWNEERGPVLIEVNPRVTCAYVGLSGKIGRNVAADVLRCHAVRKAIDGVAC